MKIELASEMGLCFGVKRAIELAQEAVRKHELLESLGPIVHNKQVVDRFAAEGMRVIERLDQMQGHDILIPSHGVGKELNEQIAARQLNVIDATCPIVHNAQTVAQKLGLEGFKVLVFGDASHAEVEGLLSWAGKGAIAVTDVPEFRVPPRRIGILSQTTQSQAQFASFLAKFMNSQLASLSEIRIFNTICDATAKRQAAAMNLAKNVDLMMVIGGHDSANTKRLAELCNSVGVKTLHIESVDELDMLDYSPQYRIGITAGASTPEWVIREVIGKLERSLR
ncbi:MAG: 4-hydroxy-3-methylbut-2-enyl diphosphate reductase [Dehalococcoidia bacterium]|nr:4-hydroxy-3-methylbut-2-enyl diphosphate reductase [Dehalococcoidia bacterium]